MLYHSTEILCSDLMQIMLNFFSQSLSACLLHTQVWNVFGKIPCQRFLLLNCYSNMLIFLGTPGREIFYGCKIFSSSRSGVRSSSVSLMMSYWILIRIFCLKLENSSWGQSNACIASYLFWLSPHLQIADVLSFCQCNWWVVPEKFSKILLNHKWKCVGMLFTISLHSVQYACVKSEIFNLRCKYLLHLIKNTCVLMSDVWFNASKELASVT